LLFFPFPYLSEAELGEKICSSLPAIQSTKPFQSYYRKARDLREGHSMKWNEGLLANSLATSKTPICSTKKKVAESVGSVKKGFLRKEFLNPHPAAIAPTMSHEAKDVGMIGLHSPLGCRIIPSSVEGNGVSQSQEWPVGFDLNGELVVWEKDDDFWDGLLLDWLLDRVQGEESLAILDAMEDEFHRDKIIARQKTKGKRELLNLKSSINYGIANAPSRRWKGKALM
jgi:hypothetical protein